MKQRTEMKGNFRPVHRTVRGDSGYRAGSSASAPMPERRGREEGKRGGAGQKDEMEAFLLSDPSFEALPCAIASPFMDKRHRAIYGRPEIT